MMPKTFGEWCGGAATAILILTAIMFATFMADQVFGHYRTHMRSTDMEYRVKRLEQRMMQVPSAAVDADTKKIIFWVGARCEGSIAQTWNLMFAEPYRVDAEALER